MDGDLWLTVILAALLIVGVGMTASSLDSVETTPDEAINIDASTVPLGVGELEEYKERITGTREDERDDKEETDPSATGDEEEAELGGEGHERDASTSDERDQQREAESESDQIEMGAGDQPFLHWLLALLRALLDLLLTLLPLLVILAILALAYAKRSWILSKLGTSGSETPATDTPEASPWLRAAPENDVERAWYEMAILAGTKQLETTTPWECANNAVAAGADPTPVQRLTRIFEEVRYGGAAITDERRSVALNELDQIKTQLGGGT